MPDNLADILKKHLVVEDKSLQDLLFEILELCQNSTGTDQAIRKLDAKRKKFSSSLDFLKKVPYVCLFLAFACFKRGYLPHAVRWAKVAIDGLDQLDQVWNRSIARWICALIYRQSGLPEDAEVFFEAAIELMKREILDLKRRSLYEKAAECEFVLDQLLKDAGLRHVNARVQLSASPSSENTPTTGNPVPRPPEDTAADLYQHLLAKVQGDREIARRLIALERLHAPRLSRVELIRRAIEHLERDNQ